MPALAPVKPAAMKRMGCAEPEPVKVAVPKISVAVKVRPARASSVASARPRWIAAFAGIAAATAKRAVPVASAGLVVAAASVTLALLAATT
jgi:hypothetical protein